MLYYPFKYIKGGDPGNKYIRITNENKSLNKKIVVSKKVNNSH